MTISDKLKAKKWVWGMLTLVSLGSIASVTYCSSRVQDQGDAVINVVDRGVALVERAYSDFSEGTKNFFRSQDESGVVHIINGSIDEEWMAVTASREIHVSYKYSTTWGGSTKSIDLEATYRVLAGVNLNKIKYEFKPSQAIVHHADGQIVACERIELRELKEEDGWWNNVNDVDRMRAQNALDEEAYKQAQQEDLLRSAEKNFIEKLQKEQQSEGMNYDFVRA